MRLDLLGLGCYVYIQCSFLAEDCNSKSSNGNSHDLLGSLFIKVVNLYIVPIVGFKIHSYLAVYIFHSIFSINSHLHSLSTNPLIDDINHSKGSIQTPINSYVHFPLLSKHREERSIYQALGRGKGAIVPRPDHQFAAEVYEHRVEPSSNEVGSKILGAPPDMGTDTSPLSPAVILVQDTTSVKFAPDANPVSGIETEYSVPPAPRLDRTVIVCPPS